MPYLLIQRVGSIRTSSRLHFVSIKRFKIVVKDVFFSFKNGPAYRALLFEWQLEKNSLEKVTEYNKLVPAALLKDFQGVEAAKK